MTGADVDELWRFLERYPDLYTNGVRRWRALREIEKEREGEGAKAGGRKRRREGEMGEGDPGDVALAGRATDVADIGEMNYVFTAIGRFARVVGGRAGRV